MKYNVITPRGKTTVIANSRMLAKLRAGRAMNIEGWLTNRDNLVYVSLFKE